VRPLRVKRGGNLIRLSIKRVKVRKACAIACCEITEGIKDEGPENVTTAITTHRSAFGSTAWITSMKIVLSICQDTRSTTKENLEVSNVMGPIAWPCSSSGARPPQDGTEY
jgi:hypothetical protein